MEHYPAIFIQTTGMQVLESVYILQNSSNIETVIGRQKFLREKYKDLIANQNDPDYQSSITTTILSYQERYSDRQLQNVQLALVKNPVEFKLEDFLSNSFLNSLRQFCKKQSEEIVTMKTDSAKQKRSIKVFQALEMAKVDIIDLNVLNEIEKLRCDFILNP